MTCPCPLCAANRALWDTVADLPRPPWTAADDAMTDNTDDYRALVSEDAERVAERRYEDSLIRRGIA